MSDLNDNIVKDLKEQILKNWGNFCPSCGALKDESTLKFLRSMGIASQFVSECPKCKSKTILTVVPNIGMQIAQIRTDINSNEFEKFSSPITSNDYLEFYRNSNYLKNTNDLITYLAGN
jgi:hypothetical protein